MDDNIYVYVPVGMSGSSDSDTLLDKFLRTIANAACIKRMSIIH